MDLAEKLEQLKTKLRVDNHEIKGWKWYGNSYLYLYTRKNHVGYKFSWDCATPDNIHCFAYFGIFGRGWFYDLYDNWVGFDLEDLPNFQFQVDAAIKQVDPKIYARGQRW